MDHTCTELTPGCYRCDLNVDEIEGAVQEARANIAALDVAIALLQDEQKDLRQEVEDMEKAVANYRKHEKRMK